MKIALQDKNHFVLRFDKGEDVIKGLQEFMTAQHVKACAFFGIGSCSDVELGYFNATLKDYRKKPYFEELEVISFQGTGAMMADAPVIHAHGMFGRTDFTVLGGHVFRMLVGATCEITVIVLDGELKRDKNPDFNLNLLV